MTAHELAKHLLEQPDYPVIMNGWGSDEGRDVEVIGTQIIETQRNTPDGIKYVKELHLNHEDIKW